MEDDSDIAGSLITVPATGDKKWRNKDGQLHRDDGPAAIWADGTRVWYRNGRAHRDDGPAVELPDGGKQWWRNGDLHRENGPAVELADGLKVWFLNGKRHREDGPAVERGNGSKEWRRDGAKVTAEEITALQEHKQNQRREQRERLIESEAAVMTTGLSQPVTLKGPLQIRRPR